MHAESKILKRLHHSHIVDVRDTYMWPKRQILVIEEELLEGDELLDAARDAVKLYDFKMTEAFAAKVGFKGLVSPDLAVLLRLIRRAVRYLQHTNGQDVLCLYHLLSETYIQYIYIYIYI
jgi:hypothetical protein